MAMSAGSGKGPIGDINVTPLVDVMLVLLIIFMITAPMLQQGVKVDLPKTKAPTMDIKEDRVVLTITRARQIFLGKTEIPFVELRGKMTNNLKLRQDKEVYLHADHKLDYGFVVTVMSILKDAGVENLGMVTDPVERGP